jgi:hypothetical protein
MGGGFADNRAAPRFGKGATCWIFRQTEKTVDSVYINAMIRPCVVPVCRKNVEERG